MRVAGVWLLCDDGVTRPVVSAIVVAADGTLYAERFLLDTGADRTVFSAELLRNLNLALSPEVERDLRSEGAKSR